MGILFNYHSQPSVNPLTTLINCMYNMFIFRYVYLVTLDKEGLMPTLRDYRQHVAGVYYGDDSIISISHAMLDIFNQMTIAQRMEETGHVYTDETKSGATRTHKRLDEVTFLKRSFKNVGGKINAALDVDTITEMVMWKRKGLTDQEAVQQTSSHAGFEAYLHGKGFYEWFTKQVNGKLDSLGLNSGIATYAEYEKLECRFLSTFTSDTDIMAHLTGR